MGQYYRLCVLNDKRRNAKNETKIAKALSSYDYDNGAKLMEFSYIGNSFVSAFESLICLENGEYAGFPVVCCGDYADNETYKLPKYSVRHMGGDEEDVRIFGDEKPNLYGLSSLMIYSKKNREKISGRHYRYIVNLDKKKFVDTEKCKADQYGCKIHPLPLLISEGNGRGGGDYHGTDENLVGSWARDAVVVTDKKPEECYKELVCHFKEHLD